MKTITVEEYDALCLCKEACKGYVRKVDDGLPPSLLSRVSYKAMQDAVRYFDRQFKDSKRKSSKHPEPKYKVGDKVLFDGREANVVKCETDNPPNILINYVNSAKWVNESELSPLPEMHIGKEWVLEQAGNPWDGMLVKCVREAMEIGKHEQDYWHGIAVSTAYPEPNGLATQAPIINCIDPAFWTGKILGEPVRCYENEVGSITYVLWQDGRKHTHHTSACVFPFEQKILESTIKNANVHIMPNEMCKNLYGDEFPAPKGE